MLQSRYDKNHNSLKKYFEERNSMKKYFTLFLSIIIISIMTCGCSSNDAFSKCPSDLTQEAFDIGCQAYEVMEAFCDGKGNASDVVDSLNNCTGLLTDMAVDCFAENRDLSSSITSESLAITNFSMGVITGGEYKQYVEELRLILRGED